jgi:hypothetical protein
MNSKAAFYMSQIDSVLIGWNVALVMFFLCAVAIEIKETEGLNINQLYCTLHRTKGVSTLFISDEK